jgi:peroxiredoxin
MLKLFVAFVLLSQWLLLQPALANGVETQWQLEATGQTLLGRTYPTEKPKELVIMIPSRQGFDQGYEQLAQALTQQNVTVWQPDWFASYDQAPTETALNSVPTTDVAALLELAAAQVERVYLMAFGRGAPLALSAWREWQKQQANQSKQSGIILVSPNLVSKTPDPGQVAEYLAITEVMDAPIWIFQPSLSPYYSGLSKLSAQLEKGGSSVWLRPLIGMRDRFFYRPDANQLEQDYAPNFARHITQAMRLLVSQAQPRQWRPLPETGIAHKQKANTGKLLAINHQTLPPLTLTDLWGKQHSLADLKGQVVLLNFWASWCPPCVHEMPSMQKLYDAEKTKGLAVVAVNLGEAPESIQAFAKTHQLHFPIWLDETQSSTQTWKVFAYPTSFLIDKQGRIRYALAGGADWFSPELRQTIQQLLDETSEDSMK